MACHNSLEFYIELLCALRRDLASSESQVSVSRDCVEIHSRSMREGLSFLTKTLPALGKALDKALSTGDPFFALGFKTKGVLPIFMGGHFERIFDSAGSVLDNPDPEAVRAIRQVTLYYYKLNVSYGQEQNDKVIRSFVEIEEALKSFSIDPRDPILRRARTLCTRVFQGVDSVRGWDNINPRHGPGAVSSGERGEAKYLFRFITRDLIQRYPFDGYFCTGLNAVADSCTSWADLEVRETGTAKVVLVPKDSRGPRLISCEPVDKQWVQQGLMDLMVKTIESHPSTRGFVNFTSQEVNRRLALSSSRTAKYVTLDMKDASDRVPFELVKYLFAGTQLLEALIASRSSQTVLPDGTIQPLLKFAPMGSAVCFPVEALVFWSLATASIQLTRGLHYKAKVPVYVYGDDIIVRSIDYRVVHRTLPLYFLKWNDSKCCTSRFFRESCGCDAFNGVDVTPVRYRKVITSSRDASLYSSLLALCNSHKVRGYEHSWEILLRVFHDLWPGGAPFTSNEEIRNAIFVWSPAEARMRNSKMAVRFGKRCYLQVRTWVPVTRRQKRLCNGWAAGLRSLVERKQTRTDFTSVELLRLKRGWLDFPGIYS